MGGLRRHSLDLGDPVHFLGYQVDLGPVLEGTDEAHGVFDHGDYSLERVECLGRLGLDRDTLLGECLGFCVVTRVYDLQTVL